MTPKLGPGDNSTDAYAEAVDDFVDKCAKAKPRARHFHTGGSSERRLQVVLISESRGKVAVSPIHLENGGRILQPN